MYKRTVELLQQIEVYNVQTLVELLQQIEAYNVQTNSGIITTD